MTSILPSRMRGAGPVAHSASARLCRPQERSSARVLSGNCVHSLQVRDAGVQAPVSCHHAGAAATGDLLSPERVGRRDIPSLCHQTLRGRAAFVCATSRFVACVLDVMLDRRAGFRCRAALD